MNRRHGTTLGSGGARRSILQGMQSRTLSTKTMTTMTTMPLIGVDFSSAPTRRKPIVLARGSRHGAVVRLEGLLAFETLSAFGGWLARPEPWLGGFDFPFGLRRELVAALGSPLEWSALVER